MIVLFYLIALIPVAIGIVLWVWKKEVVWWEALIGTVLAFLVSFIVHGIAIAGMTDDTEIWSGKVVSAIHYPRWVERYQVAVYKTVTRTRRVRVGKRYTTRTYSERVFSHYITKYRTHPEHYTAKISFGSKIQTKPISEEFYREIKKNFGGKIEKKRGSRPGFARGDRFDYHVQNHTDFIYPATMWQTWENRIKAAPTTFSFPKVPESIKVHEYPKCKNWRRSDRLLGTAPQAVSTLEWDRMCSRLGPVKKVNVIMVGFASSDSMLGQYQQAKWVGGRKNDLVLCYGGDSQDPDWSFVFGWTEKELVKRNLENILLKGPVNNKLLAEIEREIIANYKIKDWSKFDYINVEPPWWCYIILLLLVAVSQTGFYIWAYKNQNREKEPTS